MSSKKIVRSEYSYEVYGNDRNTYVDRKIKVKGDEELVRRTADKMEANLR